MNNNNVSKLVDTLSSVNHMAGVISELNQFNITYSKRLDFK